MVYYMPENDYRFVYTAICKNRQKTRTSFGSFLTTESKTQPIACRFNTRYRGVGAYVKEGYTREEIKDAKE